jgi:hypothetical protein
MGLVNRPGDLAIGKVVFSLLTGAVHGAIEAHPRQLAD